MAHIGIDARLPYYRDGGISTYVRRLIRALEQLDAHNDYTIFHRRGAPETLTQRFRRADLWTPAHHRLERLALSIELAPRRLDLFHSVDFIPPYRAARVHIITVHDLTFLHYPQYLTTESRRYYNGQIRAAVAQARHILADSDSTRHDLIAMLNVPPEKITVHLLGVGEQYKPLPAARIAPILAGYGLSPSYLLHVGTWEPRKNIPALLRAYRELLLTHADLPPLVLVGRRGWHYDDLRAECDAIGLGKRVLWLDSVPDEHLPALYNGALLNLTVSFYEGFGLPALEGMACGVVPIVSNRSSLPEIVGQVGLLVDPEDDASIATAIHRGLHDNAWRAEQQAAATRRASAFTWEACARTALDVYRAALGQSA
ncbi:MAG: glycosyltransferase family 4 protein [Anaerolineae bacterium]|nr:glycosyltransferase family 4 protein [Anaerolineae bacterium]MDW8173143.1 glycosyltransferase family 1 protein [Anaerolineae bacterium]